MVVNPGFEEFMVYKSGVKEFMVAMFMVAMFMVEKFMVENLGC